MQMDNFQAAIVVMTADDTYCGPRDADGRRRVLTAAELDTLADIGWNMPDLKGVIAASSHAVRSRFRTRASNHLDSTPLAVSPLTPP
jgi:hypothetical protein